MLIDRYIARAQLHAFVIVFVSLAGLTFVVDAFTNIEEFIAHGAEAGGLWRVLAGYYGCRLVSFFDATSPVIALASAMFALSWLERHNELTALLAAGVTRWRIARPALVFAAVVSLLAMVNRELVLPQIRHAFSRNAQDLRGDAAHPFEARYDHRTEILFRGRTAQMGRCRIEAPSLLLPPALAEYGPQIDAAEAFWMPATPGRPAGYLLVGVTEPADVDRLQPLAAGDDVVVLTRSTASWLEPGQCYVVSDVSFEQMIGSTNWSQYSSTPDLVGAIANPSLGVGADVPLRVHARFVAPVLDMSLAVLGIPLVVGPNRRGIFVAVGSCVAMTVLFFLVTMGCHALATGYLLSPSLGAWLPLLVLAPLAAWRAQPLWQ
ncbi:MAG: LptF/LptG family permease [Planctomycetia bacterium]|nr:LptF/LptG family permease [Planctomycetia bacterium]